MSGLRKDTGTAGGGAIFAALAVLAGLLLGPAAPAAATELDLGIRSLATGELLGKERVSLGPGEETRFVRQGVRLPGIAQPVDLVLGVTLREETWSGAVTVELRGIVRPAGRSVPLSWTSRVYTLGRGEAASFSVYPEASQPGVEFAAGYDSALEVEGRELPRVRLSTRLRLREGSGPQGRVLEERTIRLVGPEATEVLLESPGGGESLVLWLRPRQRSEGGVVLDLTVESVGPGPKGPPPADLAPGPAKAGLAPGPAKAGLAKDPPRIHRQEQLQLGWEDTVEVAALRGSSGPVLVEIQPQR